MFVCYYLSQALFEEVLDTCILRKWWRKWWDIYTIISDWLTVLEDQTSYLAQWNYSILMLSWLTQPVMSIRLTLTSLDLWCCGHIFIPNLGVIFCHHFHTAYLRIHNEVNNKSVPWNLHAISILFFSEGKFATRTIRNVQKGT